MTPYFFLIAIAVSAFISGFSFGRAPIRTPLPKAEHAAAVPPETRPKSK